MTEKTKTELSRRHLLARIGGLAAAAYTIPAFTTMSMAHASDGGSAASAESAASSPSETSDASEASDVSAASGMSEASLSSSASGCEPGTSWDGKTYTSSGKACLPD